MEVAIFTDPLAMRRDVGENSQVRVVIANQAARKNTSQFIVDDQWTARITDAASQYDPVAGANLTLLHSSVPTTVAILVFENVQRKLLTHSICLVVTNYPP